MESDRDEERVSLHPLDPVTALRGLLRVKPDEDADERSDAAREQPKPKKKPKVKPPR
jgi:hypothetical protein